MKINYKNGDYGASIISLIVLMVIILFVIIPILIYESWFSSIINGDISNLIFVLVFLSLTIIPSIFLFKDYKKRNKKEI